MILVKCSDRLPDKKGCYCIIDHRYNNRRLSSWYSPNGKNGNSLMHRYPKEISWLDEAVPDKKTQLLMKQLKASEIF